VLGLSGHWRLLTRLRLWLGLRLRLCRLPLSLLTCLGLLSRLVLLAGVLTCRPIWLTALRLRLSTLLPSASLFFALLHSRLSLTLVLTSC